MITRRFNRWLGMLLLVGGLAFWWLLLENAPEGAQPLPLHIATLRQLAGQRPGPAPDAVAFEMVATARRVGDLVVAGGGLKKRSLAVGAFELTVPGAKPVMINSGPGAVAAATLGYKPRPDALARVESALGDSGMILLTEGRPLTASGLLALAARPGKASLLTKACLGPEQLADLSAMPRRLAPLLPLPPACLSGAQPQAVAPGIVVIPASGHARGSQMIYVRLTNGREYLFAGETAPLEASWNQLRARGRLLGDLRDREDRGAVFSWLLTIRQLVAEAPGLVVVPGSDRAWLTKAATDHVVAPGFAPTRP